MIQKVGNWELYERICRYLYSAKRENDDKNICVI